MMTHDVEGPAGRDFCGALMDLDESFDIPSAFQIIPEASSQTFDGLMEQLRQRGFEVNVHDLNHDGYLFHNKTQFLRRAALINGYARDYGCDGFRSGAMYREQSWFDAFEFAYDMSVPNVAHLDPQRGGCCTVMPYFVGRVLELPLTTIQDYSLFHILGDYSISVWKRQIEEICTHNGLITLLTHPDYLIEQKARNVYIQLLSHLQHIRRERRIWTGLPSQINDWWRQRHSMTLVRDGHRWRVVGDGSERASVAYASISNGRVTYSLQDGTA
jgi:hypothetical protein